MQYNQIEEMRKAHQEQLKTRQQDAIAAENGLALKAEDHQFKVFLYFMNNSERMAKLERWYPVVYKRLEKQYPWVCKNPDDYPPSVIRMVNDTLSHMLTPSAFTELKLIA